MYKEKLHLRRFSSDKTVLSVEAWEHHQIFALDLASAACLLALACVPQKDAISLLTGIKGLLISAVAAYLLLSTLYLHPCL